ncbi:MAG TPA: cyclase [Alphaproteobacteria bacterium]|nr:cyclase [Alphaproteobacteria bacterium]
MVRLFVRHEVADYTTWRRVYDKFDAERKAMGATARQVFQAAGDPNDVTAWHDFATLEKARSFASSEQLKEAMGRAGVRGKPEMWFAVEVL